MTKDETDKVNRILKELDEHYAGAPFRGAVMRFAELTARDPAAIERQLGTVSGQAALAKELGTYPRSHFLALV